MTKRRAFQARLAGIAAGMLLALGAAPALADPSFSVTLPAGATKGPVTGRLIVVAASTDTPEPRLWTGMNGPPSFGIDVDALRPGAAALVDQHAVGYPIDINQLPPGEYNIQAVLIVYTQVKRADGHKPLSMGVYKKRHRNSGSQETQIDETAENRRFYGAVAGLDLIK